MDAIEILHAAARPDGPRLDDLTEAVLTGPCAAAGLQVRPGQVEMARAVADAIVRRGRLLVEAPTGSGKGLAYLVPAILGVLRHRSSAAPDARAVVSTANIALQRQLVDHDLPMLGAALGIEITVATLKGRGNYVCLDRLATASTVATRWSSQLDAVRDWVAGGGSGDREDLPWPLEGGAWSAASVTSDECLGDACAHASACFANLAHARARTAAVVVVNHAYLARAWKTVVRGAAVVVVDEAHELADAIRGSGSDRFGPGLARYWSDLVVRRTGDRSLADRLRRELARVVAAEPGRLRPGWLPDVTDVVDAVMAASTAVRAAGRRQGDEETERAAAEARALGKLADRVAAAAAADPAVNGRVTWADRQQDGRTVVQSSPVRAQVPPAAAAVVLCSATLDAGAGLLPVAQSLGLASSGQPQDPRALDLRDAPALLKLPSSWPLAEMAVVVVPPAPGAVSRDRWADDQILAFVRACGGGCLVLATSWVRTRAIGDLLRRSVPYRVLQQGEAGRADLLAAFAADRDACLVGTRSLYQGVDVAGDACRGVVIDRVPFASPSDPLEQAISEAIEASGGNPFRDRTLAVATAQVRQGAGRLLRSPSDRGAILLLDERLRTASWGATILRSLDPLPVSADVEDAARILAGEPLRGVRAPVRRTRVVRA